MESKGRKRVMIFDMPLTAQRSYKSADEKTHDFNRVDDSPQIF